MEYEYSTYSFDEKLLDDNNGSWKILGIIDYPDLEFRNDKNELCSLISHRMSAIKVWYSNGPQYYTLSYSHNVSFYLKDKKEFIIDLILKDKEKKQIKLEKIKDNIYKSDKARRTFWTYILSKTELKKVFSSSANLLIN